jgi:Zn-dependent alcohol dehydrogenase
MLHRTVGKYPYDKIVSHKFPLEDINEAFAQQDKGAITRSSLVP